MNSVLARWFLVALVFKVFANHSSGAESPVVHDPAIHTGGGLKKELIAGITAADFLKLGDKPRVARIVVVTAFNEENSWLNFNGYFRGGAVYTVPVGWTVEVIFINPSPAPHSAIVVERDMVRKVQVGEPAFAGASIPNPVFGISTSKATFSFVANTAGEYAIACGVPTHAAGGHWVALNVSAAAQGPKLKLGDLPERDAK
jgi:hypothetical protein